MTNTQLYFAMAATFITVFGLVFGVFSSGLYKYLDAKFTSIDNQLKFLVEHIVDHAERISKLEERTKDK